MGNLANILWVKNNKTTTLFSVWNSDGIENLITLPLNLKQLIKFDYCIHKMIYKCMIFYWSKLKKYIPIIAVGGRYYILLLLSYCRSINLVMIIYPATDLNVYITRSGKLIGRKFRPLNCSLGLLGIVGDAISLIWRWLWMGYTKSTTTCYDQTMFV